MKIEKAQIRNFRILKELDVDFEDVLSVVIGKNNAGKTSFLEILKKFLDKEKPEFSFDDFSISIQNEICGLETTSLVVEDFSEPTLSLKLYISYTEDDDISDASELLLDLDECINHFVLYFEYGLSFEKHQNLISDYREYKNKVSTGNFRDYVAKHINRYFVVRVYALEYGNESNRKDIVYDTVRKIISIQTIDAKRDVANEQGRSKSLSSLALKYYNAIGSDTAFPKLQEQLLETDENLTKEYKTIFKSVVDEIRDMSYNPKEAEISIISSLMEKQIFQNNTIVKYRHNGTLLPEDYNGLGYLNLFAIMFDIRIKLDKLSKKNNRDERPTPMNLLFIEEPEAHTHPQMQYVFITNIKKVLEKQKSDVLGFFLQTVISTHSAHIVSQCDFQDIKYFYREAVVVESGVRSKSLKSLYSAMITSNETEGESEKEKVKKKIEIERTFRFVKQYVTLNRSELFFADKAVLIEGDTERMLLTAMIKKYDEGRKNEDGYIPLLSQNISVIEVGAYSHVFAAFLEFVGIKTLILTDLDCAKKNENNRLAECSFSEATTTTNASIKYFTGNDNITDIVKLADENKTFSYATDESKWVADIAGILRVAFQKQENDYQASSFEDAFLCCNLDFVVDYKDIFQGLKCRDDLSKDSTDFYGMAKACVDGKTTFALDILMNGGENGENWNIPLYIKEGLEWLVL